MPARISAWSIYKVFDTKDEQKIFIGIISEKHWLRFCEIFGWKDWLADERLATNNGRIDQRNWFVPELNQRVQAFTKSEIIQKCEQAQIPFAPISRPEDLANDPQLNEGQQLVNIPMPNGATAKLPKFPLEYGDSQIKKYHDPPEIGEHSEALLKELGLDEKAIQSLKENSII